MVALFMFLVVIPGMMFGIKFVMEESKKGKNFPILEKLGKKLF